MAQQVSDWWKTGRYDASSIVGRVELLDAQGAPFRDSDHYSTAPIQVTEANYSVDRTRATWGSAGVRLLLPWDADQALLDLLPRTPLSPTAPTSGVTFRLSLGFHNPNDNIDELVYCGRYDIDTTQVNETAAGIVIDLDGVDLTGRMDVEDLAAPWLVEWGSRIIDAAKALVYPAMPWIGFVEDATTDTCAYVALDESANRWAEITKMMRSIGFEAFMDMSGTSMRMRRIPTTEDVPAWTFDPDEWPDPIAIGQNQQRDRVYNGVFVKGENPNSTDPPVRSTRWIEDANDPTHFIPGPPVQTNIGPRPFRFTSQYIREQHGANLAADAELRRIRGLLQRVQVEIVTNPAINAGDVIYVARDDIGVIGRYVVNSLAYRYGDAKMTLTCEERRV